MAYVDVAIAAVPEGNREAYLGHARDFADFAKAEGATACFEFWGDDVPDGEITSFPMAVKAEAGEVVCVSVYKWPDKQTRDAAWAKMMSGNAMPDMGEMPFDGKRMIFGGFDVILEG